MKVAYIVRSWPRLSQTFVVNEILALERMGVAITLFAMAATDEPLVQPQVGDVAAPVRYLERPPGGIRRSRPHLVVARVSPGRYLSTLAFAMSARRLLGGYTQSRSIGAFDQAVRVAADVETDRAGGEPVTHIHAHFAHDPALIGLLVHRLTGLPFTFTGHARDLYQIPGPALVGRIREATTVVTCCQANVDHIQRTAAGAATPVELIYHGVDLDRFRPLPRPEAEGAAVTPLIVSVGRLVDKKGFDDLLRALAIVARLGRPFRAEIYGGGPSLDELLELRDELGLGGVIAFPGPTTQQDLVSVYQWADVFALAPRVTADGDRDGVPNVILEAMACGLPIVSTPVGGIPEAVGHDVNGLLAPANDPAGIAACLVQLLDDPRLRQRLGAAGADRAARFDSREAAGRLAVVFGYRERAIADDRLGR